MKALVLILYFLLLSCIACEKETACYNCVTTYTYKMAWRQYDDNAKPVVFTEETRFSVCDMTEDNIMVLENSSSDSTWWSSGYIFNEVSRVTRCQIE